MILFELLIYFLLLCCQETVSGGIQLDATPANPDKLAISYGYCAEKHEITTADGYILTAFRIVNSTTFSRTSVPFILQHGMGSNGGQWVLLGQDKSLAFMLADSGYDVWVSNTRGSLHSRKHKTLSMDSADFWDYSWHEKGIYDMPAIVDHILNTSRHDQLFYVGHSEGGSMFYVMNSLKPQYNKKVRHAFLMAPAGYMSHSQGAMFAPRTVTPAAVRYLQMVGKTFFKNRFKPSVVAKEVANRGLCKILFYACAQAVNLAMGYNPRTGGDGMRQGLDIAPDCVTVGEIAHYGQLITLPFTFRMYDYYENNMAKYNATEPPRYPIWKITTPITFMYAKNDRGIAEEDIEHFNHDVPNGHLYLVPDPNFNHLDFVLNPFVKDIVNTPVLKIANSYQNTAEI